MVSLDQFFAVSCVDGDGFRNQVLSFLTLSMCGTVDYMRSVILLSFLLLSCVCVYLSTINRRYVCCATLSGAQSGTTNSTGSTQMHAWVQGAIAKISGTTDGVSTSTPNPLSGPAPYMPISINTGTFPGTPAVRLIGDCHFLHRLCQLLLFCFFFRRAQLPRYIQSSQRMADASMQKPQSNAAGKVEENQTKSMPTAGRPEDSQGARSNQLVAGVKVEDGPASRARLGTGNAGQGYTFDEVNIYLFLFAPAYVIFKVLCLHFNFIFWLNYFD